MFSIFQARQALLMKEPSVTVEDMVVYRNVYLFRVRFPSEEEADYDPFFSVDISSGEVKDFSILTDGDITEIAALFADTRRSSNGD